MTSSRVTSVSQGVDRRVFLRRCGGAAAFFLAGCGLQKRNFARAEGTTSAERAIHAAKRFAGMRLNVGWEAGYQAQALIQFAAPLWKELTGIHIDVVELGVPLDQFRRIAAEHLAGTGALDCAAIAPTWIPDLLQDGALEPLDEYIAHYMLQKDLEDYLPMYRTLGLSHGRRYGLFDDGDVLLLYYRKDVFDDPLKQKDFEAKHGRPLGNPGQYNWQQFIDVARFFTNSYAPDLYGLAPLTRELSWACFEYRLRLEGGQFFEPATMKPGVDTPAGSRALTQVKELTQVMVPVGGMEPSLAVPFSSYLSGKCAMAIFWPALGRWAEQGTASPRLLEPVPRSQIVGKTGYALLPDGIAQLAVGFVLSVLAHSRNKEAAYLFIQWLSSPDISLRRVMQPDALRDPYRFSHIHAPEFGRLWPTAGEYLDILEKAASGAALLELMIPGTHEYQAAFYETLTNIRLGTPVETALKQMAQSWEQITERYGRGRQKKAYADFLTHLGAVPPHLPSAKTGILPG